MKKRLIFIVAFAAALCSCDTDPSLRILGVWYLHDNTKNIELTFDANNQFLYYEGPVGMEDWGGRQLVANYVIHKDSLTLSFPHPFDTTYSTCFYISNKKLTIDAFPYHEFYEKMTFKRKD
jgi:hypothetical protein